MSPETPNENSDLQLPPIRNGLFNGEVTSATPADISADERAHAAAPTGRDRRGRFGKGNKGGPGNPFARRGALLRQAALGAVSPETVRDILAALVVRALTGDLGAAKLIFNFALGKSEAEPELEDIVDGSAITAAGEIPSLRGENGRHL